VSSNPLTRNPQPRTAHLELALWLVQAGRDVLSASTLPAPAAESAVAQAVQDVMGALQRTGYLERVCGNLATVTPLRAEQLARDLVQAAGRI
jgi:hypothetical protein